MWPEPVERVGSTLRAAAVESTIQEFPEGTPTAEAAARAIGCSLEQIVKSIVFVCDGAFVLALIPGDRRADEAKVSAEVSAEEIRVAYAREVVAATGFEPGSVAPFPLLSVGEVLLERTLLQYGVVWIGAGSPAHMASISPTDLQRLSGARAVDIASRR
jgi:prolyl-tRNA editing enzyme YbaK/EbsC (Cys-tRNA(Pro) deacylase)